MGKPKQPDTTLSDVAEEYIIWLNCLAEWVGSLVPPDTTFKRRLKKLASDFEDNVILIEKLVASGDVPIKRRMGRNSRLSEREKKARFWLECYWRTQELHDVGNISWVEVMEQVADEFTKERRANASAAKEVNVSTVRKGRSLGKKIAYRLENRPRRKTKVKAT